ncbi:DNA repair protein RadA [Acidaminobacter sp. JC074]|uniref:DNA repair protein RadA n=1 Tax=Acidaminobacter sp. JC074 TaxID=2530199 RepID=UPI001F0E8251|nr:DNA repair protein RadA [Acidaminobacter sp. JC074]MCH4890450.1 DNA repair protein RadA [Acidaminobacter sp. JC074]
MGKIKTRYVCQECGAESNKWLGKCPTCGEWNTFVEEFIDKPVVTKSVGISNNKKPVPLSQVVIDDEVRYKTHMKELDNVLGGGIVKGSLVLVGGDPGIGKSTLLLQVANTVGMSGQKVLYVSGEESLKQTKLRADRLSIKCDQIYMVSENNLDYIVKYVEELSPDILIVDSIQTVYNPAVQSSPGSVSQVREATATLMKISKVDAVATFIVGHVTKSGSIAGPKVLEHMVDTVLYFEGDKNHTFRILRGVKNRFGSTNEIGIFEMTFKGLKEVLNPSEIFLSNRPESAPGSVVVAGMEGTRPVLVEIQALISNSSFGTPRRMAVGVDHNKMVMMMAILEKRLGIQIGGCDAYLNVVGGMQLSEPATDLAIVAAVISSFKDKVLEEGVVIFGEVGLTGEVRSVSHVEQRIHEAIKLGFKKCILPKGNLEQTVSGIELITVENVEEMLNYLF